jgi:hypothetical protein
MKTSFQIKGLDFNNFHHLFSLTDKQLKKVNAKRIVVNENPGFPCRISLVEAEIGETILALSYRHHDVESPYKSSGPIFIRENVTTANLKVNELPQILENRHLSLRAYNNKNMMVNALTTQNNDVENKIQYLLAVKTIVYIHIHNANPGCYSCRVERAQV